MTMIALRRLGLVASLLGLGLFACSCGDDGDSPAGGGGTGGGAAGAGGSTAGAGGSTAGAGGSTAGAGGSTAGAGGSTAGAGGSTAGAGGSTAGAGGTSSGGTAGSAGAGPECVTVDDCMLFNDCCACTSLAKGEAEPAHACPLASCIQSHCDALGGADIQCLNGACVLTINCDLSKITCKMAEPNCDVGFVPITNAAGDCYAGCAQLSECPNPT